MSYSQLIKAINEHTDKEGQRLFAEFLHAISFIRPDYAAGLLQLALEDDDLAAAVPLVDQLEQSLKDHYKPHHLIGDRVHRKDMKRWFEFLRYFVGAGRQDGALDIMWFYPHIFNPSGKTRCGAMRSRCSKAGVRRKDTYDGTCMYKFQQDEMICPKCDTPRTLCRKRPASNGRCSRSGGSIGHGGDTAIGALSPSFIDGRNQFNRPNIFAKQLEHRPQLQRMFIEAMQDPNYLSLEPEIALIAARRGELLSELDAMDPAAIEASVSAAVKQMRAAIAKDKYESVVFYATEIENLLEGGRDNRDRWREMNSLAGQMARLADTERKRIVEAKKSVTVEEMILLRNETVKAIRTAVIDGAEELHHDIMWALDTDRISSYTSDKIRGTMLRHIANRLRPLEEAERAEIIELVQEQEEE